MQKGTPQRGESGYGLGKRGWDPSPGRLGGLLLTVPEEVLARAGAARAATSSMAAQVAWHSYGSCSRTWGEELLRLITPARAGLVGLFLTVLIEAGFLLTFTLLHHYRLPGFQPPR